MPGPSPMLVLARRRRDLTQRRRLRRRAAAAGDRRLDPAPRSATSSPSSSRPLVFVGVVRLMVVGAGRADVARDGPRARDRRTASARGARRRRLRRSRDPRDDARRARSPCSARPASCPEPAAAHGHRRAGWLAHLLAGARDRPDGRGAAVPRLRADGLAPDARDARRRSSGRRSCSCSRTCCSSAATSSRRR